MTSSAHDADFKENNFRRTIHPQSFIAVASLFAELDRGGFRTPPPVQKIEKKAGLDRVKDCLRRAKARVSKLSSAREQPSQWSCHFFHYDQVMIHPRCGLPRRLDSNYIGNYKSYKLQQENMSVCSLDYNHSGTKERQRSKDKKSKLNISRNIYHSYFLFFFCTFKRAWGRGGGVGGRCSLNP